MIESMPHLVFADSKGNIMDFPGLAMVGRSGDYFLPVTEPDTIPLPKGAQLYVLPDRHPIGLDRETGEIVTLSENPYDGSCPILCRCRLSSGSPYPDIYCCMGALSSASELPLFAYTALGWNDGFVTTAMRTDPSRRQDPDMFNQEKVEERGYAMEWTEDLHGNRLVEHLAIAPWYMDVRQRSIFFKAGRKHPCPHRLVVMPHVLGAYQSSHVRDLLHPRTGYISCRAPKRSLKLP